MKKVITRKSKFVELWLLKLLYGRTLKNDSGIACFANDWMTVNFLVFGDYEEIEKHFLSLILNCLYRRKSDWIALDVGANIGVYSRNFAKEGYGQTIAFEPHPENFRVLRANTEQYSSVKIFNIGLGQRK